MGWHSQRDRERGREREREPVTESGLAGGTEQMLEGGPLKTLREEEDQKRKVDGAREGATVGGLKLSIQYTLRGLLVPGIQLNNALWQHRPRFSCICHDCMRYDVSIFHCFHGSPKGAAFCLLS